MSFTPFSYRAVPLKISWSKRSLGYDQNDGDSVWLMMDKGEYQYSNANCRLFGINAPELNDKDPEVRKKAQNSREYLTGLLGGPVPCPHDWVTSVDQSTRFCRICCQVDKLKITGPKELFVRSEKLDKYGRPLATIWTSQEDFGDYAKSVNQAMIDAGHAVKYVG